MITNGKSKSLDKPRLPFDVLIIIAHASRIDLFVYKALLSIPRFGRASLSSKYQLLHQSHFTQHTINSNGTQIWFIEYPSRKTCYHRLDGPAIIYLNGDQVWHFTGNYHRIDGPAVTTLDGYKFWYCGGNLHRTDGPAVIKPNGYQAWYVHGHLHRMDGPAVIRLNGNEEYWIYGKRVTKE
jgi:hypothetical protein